MLRPLRRVDDGLIYDVICRGNNRQHVLRKSADFQALLTARLEFKVRKPF